MLSVFSSVFFFFTMLSIAVTETARGGDPCEGFRLTGGVSYSFWGPNPPLYRIVCVCVCECVAYLVVTWPHQGIIAQVAADVGRDDLTIDAIARHKVLVLARGVGADGGLVSR